MPAEPGQPKKRIGCIILATGVFLVWAFIACLLWQWAMQAPVPQKDEEDDSPRFELIPSSSD